MKAQPADPIELAVFQNAVHSIAEEMGAALRRTAVSPNIKERRDYSCAIFDGAARVIAMGDHMPVHLGSMPMSVQAAVASIKFAPGDIAILNDPYAGGTHLPDITMALPVFLEGSTRPDFFVANRAHHADVGGRFPGSMGPAEEIFQEGIRIPPVRIVRGGEIDREMLDLILLNVRTPREREGDLVAQIGSCRVGERRIREIVHAYGSGRVESLIEDLLDYSERLVRAELRSMPAGEFTAEDWLDDDGVTETPLKIAVRITLDPTAAFVSVDFSGTSPQAAGSVNAVRAITLSACFYVLRCLLPESAPATGGILRPTHSARARGHLGERTTSRARSWRQCRNVPAHRRCAYASSRPSSPASYSCVERRNHEQPDHRRNRSAEWPAVHLLRNHRGRHGRASGSRWNFGCPNPHDQLAQHPDRSAGIRLSAAPAALRIPRRFWRRREVSRRRWPGARD